MAHKAGSFCWTELHTTDVAKAKAFYSEVLGWKYKEVPMPGGEGGTYVMPQVGGKDAAGMGGMPPGTPPGVPPHWSIYVAVDDVDATVKKSTELGGKTLMPAFDIPDVGRMAIIQDPTGGVLGLWWKDGAHAGTGSDREAPGAFCWAELLTTKVDTARDFYTKLLPWKAKAEDTEYTEWQVGGESIGGLMTIPKEAAGMPPSWGAYFTVTNVDETIARAKTNGGQILNGPMVLENVGTFATIADPTGAVFSIYQSARAR